MGTWALSPAQMLQKKAQLGSGKGSPWSEATADAGVLVVAQDDKIITRIGGEWYNFL